ncbi:MAG TPA: 16S rRNA (cytosine(1402)-N(4))-methyltransferase RsmH, partial [Chitinophagales bacterium]|nr:16S rRNA (cytosine(1402)-N(4))-methyltransferase RsmH [Chitinophagales bacterium]
MSEYHVPVLLQESIEGLNIQAGGTYVDVTYGGGGHSKAILEKIKNGRLIAFDQDTDAAANVISDERLLFVNQNFKHLRRMLRVNGINEVDGILADLGISSYQVDTEERGFAHRLEGPLDMRMDKQASLTAADVVNEYAPSQLQHIFGAYGEVRNARTLAQLIGDKRNLKRI